MACNAGFNFSESVHPEKGHCILLNICATIGRKELLHWKLHFLTALAASHDDPEQTYRTLQQALLEAKDDAVLAVRSRKSQL